MSGTQSMLMPGLSVSRETIGRLEAYADLIRKWTKAINLVAPASLPDLWDRHILDSAQLLPLAPLGTRTWADLGSGAGLPGVVIAILAPQIRVTLVESDQRKAAFLRTCARDLNLTASILTERAESAAPLASDVVSARALAPLDALLPMVGRHLAPNGIALLPKGKTARAEVATASRTWSFDLQSHDSQTNTDAAILRLERITRA